MERNVNIITINPAATPTCDMTQYVYISLFVFPGFVSEALASDESPVVFRPISIPIAKVSFV